MWKHTGLLQIKKRNFENIQDRTRSCWGVNNLLIALTCIFSVKKVETHFLGCTCVRFTQPCAHRTKRRWVWCAHLLWTACTFFALLRGNRKTKMWITLKQCICKQLLPTKVNTPISENVQIGPKVSIFCVATIIFQHCLNPLGHEVHQSFTGCYLSPLPLLHDDIMELVNVRDLALLHLPFEDAPHILNRV